MVLPALARPGEILTLMRPAALLAGERSPGDAFGYETHVPQVVEVEPFGIEPAARGREVCAFRFQPGDVLECTLETCAGAQRPDMLTHQPLEICDLARPIGRANPFP